MRALRRPRPRRSYQNVNAPAAAFGALQAQASLDAGRGIAKAGDELSRTAAMAAQQETERATKNADASAIGSSMRDDPLWRWHRSQSRLSELCKAMQRFQPPPGTGSKSTRRKPMFSRALPQRAQQIFGSVAASRASDTMAKVNQPRRDAAHAGQYRSVTSAHRRSH